MFRSQRGVFQVRWTTPRHLTSLHLLSALREMVFSGTLDVCRAFFSDPKVDAVGEAAPANSTSLRGGRAGGDVDPVETPDLVTEDDPSSQASHPSDGLLPGAGGNLVRLSFSFGSMGLKAPSDVGCSSGPRLLRPGVESQWIGHRGRDRRSRG